MSGHAAVARPGPALRDTAGIVGQTSRAALTELRSTGHATASFPFNPRTDPLPTSSMFGMERAHRFSTTQTRAVSLTFYGGMVLLLTLIMTKQLSDILPKSVAKPIGYDSEGFFLALVLAAWIQFACWRLDRRRLGVCALCLSALFLAIGIGLLVTDLPSPVKTLNEASIALAVLIPYVSLRRPLGSWPLFASAALTAMVFVGAAIRPDSLVVNLAETMVALIIAPWVFDLFDRRVLDPTAPGAWRMRLCGYALLIAIPVIVVLLGTARRTEGGMFNDVLHYLGRSQESFVGILLTVGFLSLLVGMAHSHPARRTAEDATDLELDRGSDVHHLSRPVRRR